MQNVSTISPIVKEIPWIEPSALFKSVASKRHVFCLDSSLSSNRLGRYSYIGFEPFMTCTVNGASVRIYENDHTRHINGDPFEIIDSLIAKHRVLKIDAPVPFLGGAVGYLGYELRHFAEKLPRLPKHPAGYADAWFGFYDSLFAFDHQLHKAYFISNSVHGFDKLTTNGTQDELTAGQSGGISSNMSFDEYVGMVNKAKQYIDEGEIYQANLSQQFKCHVSQSPDDLYLGLRSRNPAPFSCYLDTGEVQILSSSPERFLKIDGARIETRPIKGTMPRGRTPEEDERLASKLQASAKDKAEHIMIVDLERNDLGRVCVPGSVNVDELMTPEKYATVHHLTSTITGTLRPDKTIAQILKACFPGGSITGAPKIRAMQIIDELEPTSRGVYTGSIGYLGFNGDLDLNIAIRTIVLQNGTASFNLGGGIVHDSDPQKEYQETLDKGKAIFELLTSASDPT